MSQILKHNLGDRQGLGIGLLQTGRPAPDGPGQSLPMTTTISESSRPSLLALHPIEAFLALLLISAAAIHRLLSDPPHLLKRPEVEAPAHAEPAAPLATDIDPSTAIRHAAERLATASLTVVQLRTMARERGIRSIYGVAVRSARRAYLLKALNL